MDADIAIKRINAILDSDIRDLSRTLPHRTLVLAAHDDLLVPKFLSDEVAATIPHAEYVVLADGGHFHPETKSHAFNRTVGDFLAETATPATAITDPP